MISDPHPLFGKIHLMGVNLEVADPVFMKPREDREVFLWPWSGIM